MVTVALIGGSGFVGSHLARHLLASSGYDVRVIDLDDGKLRLAMENGSYQFERIDIRDSHSELEQAISAADVVVNLAAHVRPSMFLRKPLQVVDVNFFANFGIVNACVRHRKFLLHFSTSEVYGKSGGHAEPFKEDETDCILGPIANHRWIYSSAKQLLDRIIHAHGLAGDLDYAIVRPFNFVGPLMDHVVPRWSREENPRVLANFMSALIYNRPLRLVNGGQSRRCFTYIDDAVDALERIIRHRKWTSRQIINIGNPDNETTIADLAALLIRIYRAHCDPRAEPTTEEISGEAFYGAGYEDCDRRMPDISKMKRLGWTPRFGLEETFTRCAVYFYKNRARLEALRAQSEREETLAFGS